MAPPLTYAYTEITWKRVQKNAENNYHIQKGDSNINGVRNERFQLIFPHMKAYTTFTNTMPLTAPSA